MGRIVPVTVSMSRPRYVNLFTGEMMDLLKLMVKPIVWISRMISSDGSPLDE